MDDAKQQIEDVLKSVEGALAVAGPLADVVLVVLEQVRESEITEKAGTIVDKALGELANIFRPITTRWNDYQKDRIEWLADRVKEMTGEEELEEGTAVEVLKIHQAAVMHGFQYTKENFWENRAKALQHKLEATTTTTSTDKAVSNLLARFPWKR
jgi:hypothetical protein